MPQTMPEIFRPDPHTMTRVRQQMACQQAANGRISNLIERIEDLPLSAQLQSLRAYQREHDMGESLWEQTHEGRRGRIYLFDGQVGNEPLQDAVTRKTAEIRRTEAQRCTR